MELVLRPAEWSVLVLSIQVAMGCVLTVVVPGTACGWLLARHNFPGKALLDGVLHLPLVLPPVVIGYGLLLVFGRQGPVGSMFSQWLGIDLAFTWQAAVFASAVVAFPLVVRSVRLAVELVDPRLEQAAATLGASPLRTCATVTLPLAIPGILAGMVLAFARSLGEFGATITFAGNLEGQTRTLPLALYTAMQRPGGESVAARLAILSTLLALAAMVVSEATARRIQTSRGRH